MGGLSIHIYIYISFFLAQRKTFATQTKTKQLSKKLLRCSSEARDPLDAKGTFVQVSCGCLSFWGMGFFY